ncbi:unnamed protein product [Symbiodinium natans]|uniref:Uncharacterized protein n=1 Tax=Symbiodinium natans TaxID=878477 RepID=A0A812LRN5_9DINO|nr:unnamed protein product [Symbiodinium natans]
MTWEALKRVYTSAFGIPRASHLAIQLLPRLKSCCGNSENAGVIHFIAATRPNETEPYMMKVGKSSLHLRENSPRALACLESALRRYKRCTVEAASSWQTLKVFLFTHEAHAWEFESGFHSIAYQTYPGSLLYNPDIWTEVRERNKRLSRSNWEVYHGANIPELLALADRLFRLPRSEFLPLRAEAWQLWSAQHADFFFPPQPRPALCCDVDKVEEYAFMVCRTWQEWCERGLSVLKGQNPEYPLHTFFRKCRGRLWKPAGAKSSHIEPARFQTQFLIRFDALHPDLAAKLRDQLKMPLAVTEPVMLRRSAANVWLLSSFQLGAHLFL